MNSTHNRKTRLAANALVFGVAFLLLTVTTALARKAWRYSLEPAVTLDFDMEDIPEPQERDRAFYYDFLYATFGLQTKEALDFGRNFRKLARKPKQAYNVNVLGDVPDSSWFTNRNATRTFSLDEIKRGPVAGTGPAPGTWKAIGGKAEGATPGFLIQDAEGGIYQLKFDSPAYPELASAAEVITSKLYYAAGYNVKENYIVRFSRERLLLDKDGTVAGKYGRKRPMTEEDIDDILGLAARLEDGRYRAVAGKYLAGKPKGPAPFEGVRKDDPNDWIPHEHRRDLRGMRVLASWVNDNDLREGNTLDMYVEEDGRKFLRHYFIDLGSALGSETKYPNPDRVGYEYTLDPGEIAKSVFSLGLYRRPWTGISEDQTHPGVGFLESELFDPGRWKANFPILPFENMTLRDAFWGAKLVLSFTDEQIRAAVETGEFSDPQATDILTRILIERRDKIGRHWLSRVNPLDHFDVTQNGGKLSVLRFEDLEVRHGYVPAGERRYEYTVREKGRPSAVILRSSVSDTAIPLSEFAVADFPTDHVVVFQVTLKTIGTGKRRQGKPIRVYLALLPGEHNLEVVGIERND